MKVRWASGEMNGCVGRVTLRIVLADKGGVFSKLSQSVGVMFPSPVGRLSLPSSVSPRHSGRSPKLGMVRGTLLAVDITHSNGSARASFLSFSSWISSCFSVATLVGHSSKKRISIHVLLHSLLSSRERYRQAPVHTGCYIKHGYSVGWAIPRTGDR